MTLSLDSTASARIASGVRGVAWLIDLEFTSGTLSFTTNGLNVEANSRTYLALGTLVSLGAVSESADSGPDALTVTLTVTNAAMFAAAMGDPAVYRGRAMSVWLQLFDEAHQPAGAPVLRYRGYMDKVSIERSQAPPDGGDALGKITLRCSRAGLARARRAEGLRLTDAQQQIRYPGDTGLRYVRQLIEKPSLWLSKRFQEQ
jgi:hypothetical protein